MLLRGETVLARRLGHASLLTLAIATAPAHAQGAAERPTPRYNDIKQFLLDSLAAPSGGVEATIEGEFAQAFAKQFHANGTLQAQSKVAERYENGRCGRVETRLTQAGVAVAGQPQSVSLMMRVALCVNGEAYRPDATRAKP